MGSINLEAAESKKRGGLIYVFEFDRAEFHERLEFGGDLPAAGSGLGDAAVAHGRRDAVFLPRDLAAKKCGQLFQELDSVFVESLQTFCGFSRRILKHTPPTYTDILGRLDIVAISEGYVIKVL